MRIITWNASRNYRAKQEHIIDLNPDILAVQECENPREYPALQNHYTDYAWTGDRTHQGLALFTNKGQLTDVRTAFDNDLFVYGKVTDVPILACWTQKSDQYEERYIAQLYTLLTRNPELVNDNTIVLGDFNWGASIKASGQLAGNFDETVQLLRDAGLQSAYHRGTDEAFGEETASTFHQHKKIERKYHIDYIFVPTESKIENAYVGKYDTWINESDHRPVVVDVVL